MSDLPLQIVKIMKNRQYRFDTAIYFIDFHWFPLLIDKNHLIAIDFYPYRFLSIDYFGEYRTAGHLPVTGHIATADYPI